MIDSPHLFKAIRNIPKGGLISILKVFRYRGPLISPATHTCAYYMHACCTRFPWWLLLRRHRDSTGKYPKK